MGRLHWAWFIRSIAAEFPQVPAFCADAVMVDCGHCFGTLREWRNAQRLNARQIGRGDSWEFIGGDVRIM
jgi:hypothetical protein